MPQSPKQFPKNWQDAPFYYLDQGLALFPVPPRGKGTYRGSHGHLDASSDPARIRDWQSGDHWACCWAMPTGGPRNGLDIEQREIRGQDGTLSLRRHAEQLGLKESLIPYGRTPISLSPTVGFHVHFAATGVPTPSGVVLPHVELKADGASIRVPPAPGRSWEPSCPPSLDPLPTPEWVLALLHLEASERTPPLPPDGPLKGEPFTPIGRRIAEGLINPALDRATSTRAVCREVRDLARLVIGERISEPFVWRVIEYFAVTYRRARAEEKRAEMLRATPYLQIEIRPFVSPERKPARSRMVLRMDEAA